MKILFHKSTGIEVRSANSVSTQTDIEWVLPRAPVLFGSTKETDVVKKIFVVHIPGTEKKNASTSTSRRWMKEKAALKHLLKYIRSLILQNHLAGQRGDRQIRRGGRVVKLDMLEKIRLLDGDFRSSVIRRDRIRKSLKKILVQGLIMDPAGKWEYLIHRASRDGYVDVVYALISLGANRHSKDEDGWTPLHSAACCGRKEVVRFLLSIDTRRDVRTYLGEKPQDLARVNGYSSVYELLVY